MTLLLIYWSFMIIGYVIANRMSKRGKHFDFGPKLMMFVIYFLCLTMGLRMGVNQQVISNLGSIGLKAFALTVVCVAGSLAAIFAVRKIMGLDRFGDPKVRQREPELASEGREGAASGKVDLTSTFIIVAMVAAGMAVGAIVLSGMMPEILPAFDVVSNYALIVLLCILLFFVGMDLGATGNIFRTIMKVGLKSVWVALAAIVGTMIPGVIFCSILGLSIKEGAAICAGFGWYSYAPVVIAGAGQQYMIASAIAFMHNVIRELMGIIFIPVVAKKLGYLECVGIPGSCSMDLCLPLVERSCRQDTTVYAFTTGLFMCFATSLGVPLIMGL